MPRYNKLKDCTVYISHHALKRIVIRTERFTNEQWEELISEVRSGNKEAIARLNQEKKRVEKKFRDSKLSHFLEDGCELRYEIGGSKLERCNFIAEKKGSKFILITGFVQGKKRDHWKVKDHANHF